MNTEERIWILVARKLAGEASSKDLDELQQLMKQNPDISYSVQLMIDLWNIPCFESVHVDKHDEKYFRFEKSTRLNFNSKKRFHNKNFMLKNYFKIAWRNITRHKVYTIINVLGLALGICACIVIYLITSFDFSFDRFHPDQDRIYRIVGEMQNDNGEKMFSNSPFSDVAGFQHEIPGFEAKAAFHFYGGRVAVPDGDKPAKKFEGRIEGTNMPTSIITWPQYFDIFKYDWVAGNAGVLNEPFKVVLTASRAHKYFGAGSLEKMIGKTVIYEDSLRVMVAGIVKDWTEKTDLGFTDFISISTAANSFLKNNIPTTNWSSLGPHHSMAFVKLDKGITAAQINNRFTAFIKQHVKFDRPGTKLTMYLQPLTDIHFTTEYHRGDDGDNFRKAYMPSLYALMGLALFILIIAAINFINLSTAQSMQRAKEVGIRKVMGSNKINIVFQFLTETFVLTLFAVIVSVILVKPVLTTFSSFIPQGVTFHFFNGPTLLFLSIVTIATSLLAGLYPAKVLASYLPAVSLKGTALQKIGGKANLRKGLIVFQFSISLIFIVGAIVIANQIRFMRDTDKGFKSDAILTVNHWRDHNGKLKIFAESIKHIAGIDKVILQGNSPMGFAHGGESFKFKGKDEINLDVSFDAATEDFIPFYQMKLIAGRNIIHSDSLKELVINETCSKAMGFTNAADAVGKFLYTNDKPYPVVGVVADFHEGSFHEAMKPVVIAKTPGREESIAIKLVSAGKQASDVKAIISELEKQWKKIYPDDWFNYSFLDEAITGLYDQDTKTAWLVNVAMIITIFISSMGLFGLGMFTAERRTKEIGIRKVLGASVVNITTMLSKDFIALVIIALVIASPIAWYFMNQWLLDFVYRINIRWWVFALAGVGAILIALITVSFQAIKAAIANPVKSLRTE